MLIQRERKESENSNLTITFAAFSGGTNKLSGARKEMPKRLTANELTTMKYVTDKYVTKYFYFLSGTGCSKMNDKRSINAFVLMENAAQ